MLEQIKKVYLIGIGGIGMSALARWFNTHHYQVAGYDLTPTPLTTQLETEGIKIHYEDNIALIPSDFKAASLEEILIIYTPAIPKDHQEFAYFLSNHYLIKKRAEVLGWLTKDHFTIAVAGTHGKTTTSAMIAHILYNSNIPFTAFLGGIMQGYDQNLLNKQVPEKEMVMLAEADEYDKSFLHLHPDIAIVTAMDEDHLEIYGDKKHIEATFQEFTKKIKPKGRLFAKKGINLDKNSVEANVYFENYDSQNPTDYYADKVRYEEGSFVFDWHSKTENITNLRLGIPGYHNVENAVAAIAVARNLQISKNEISKAIASFKGVKRRFEYIINTPKLIYIDDYAHHPKEVEALLYSVKKMYPHQKITAIFQPHLFSRTRDFAKEFAESLSQADELILLEIYPARELPIEGVNSHIILEKVQCSDKKICTQSQLIEILIHKKEKIEVLLSIGAGDIGQMTQAIAKAIT